MYKINTNVAVILFTIMVIVSCGRENTGVNKGHDVKPKTGKELFGKFGNFLHDVDALDSKDNIIPYIDNAIKLGDEEMRWFEIRRLFILKNKPLINFGNFKMGIVDIQISDKITLMIEGTNDEIRFYVDENGMSKIKFKIYNRNNEKEIYSVYKKNDYVILSNGIYMVALMDFPGNQIYVADELGSRFNEHMLMIIERNLKIGSWSENANERDLPVPVTGINK